MNLEGKHYKILNVIVNDDAQLNSFKDVCSGSMKHCNAPNQSTCTSSEKMGSCSTVTLTCNGGNSGGCTNAVYCIEPNEGTCQGTQKHNCTNHITLPACHNTDRIGPCTNDHTCNSEYQNACQTCYHVLRNQ